MTDHCSNEPNKARSALARFKSNRNGNISILFAASLPVMLAGVGAAIDFASASMLHDQMQEAIDAATLAAASKGTADDGIALSAFLENAPDFVVVKNGVEDSWANVKSVKMKVNADGNMVGTATGTMKTSLLGIIGVEDVDIAVTATAKMNKITKIDKATFQITNAQGAYDKDIYFFTRDKNGVITSSTLILQYDYTLKSGKGTKVFTPAITTSTTVTVGDYASFGYQMVVYEDTTYTGKRVSPKSYYSDAADAAKWTRTSGNCSDTTGQTNNWEDGGDSNYADFVFNLKCTTTTSVARDVRLIN